MTRKELLGLLRQNSFMAAEANDRGLGLYTLKNDDAKKDMRLAFLNAHNIIFGTEARDETSR